MTATVTIIFIVTRREPLGVQVTTDMAKKAATVPVIVVTDVAHSFYNLTSILTPIVLPLEPTKTARSYFKLLF